MRDKLHKVYKGVESIHFEGMSELMEYDVDADDISSYNKNYFKRYIREGVTLNSRWFGFGRSSTKDVIRDALLGNADILKDARSKLRQIGTIEGEMTTVKKVKRVRVRDRIGDELDIHKVIQGNLDTAWDSRKRIEVDKKHHLYNLMIDVGANSNENVSDSIWRTVVAVKVVEELIRAGKSVQVTIGNAFKRHYESRGNDVCTISIVVKRYNEPLSLERLAAMSNIGFLRVFNFAAVHLLRKKINSHIGSSSDILSKQPTAHAVEDGSRYIYLPRINSMREAKAVLQQIYKEN